MKRLFSALMLFCLFASVLILVSCSHGGSGGEPALPDAVSFFTAIPGIHKVHLFWAAPSDNGGSAVSGYEVTMDNWVTRERKTAVQLDHVFIGLTKGVEYTFKVRAFNSAGVGVESTLAAEPGIGMVWIPAGVFDMGSPVTEQGRDPEEIQRGVKITGGFYMGMYQVTQDEYLDVMEINPAYFHGGSNSEPIAGEYQARRPAENVSWYDAVEFCNALSVIDDLVPAYTIDKTVPDPGNTNDMDEQKWTVTINAGSDGYRLPTEAQWEYACRAGTVTAYNTGGVFDDSMGWYNHNSREMTHETGKYPANAFGLFDMHGNVFEWCQDWYGSYPDGDQTDPAGAASGSLRVVRGGSWYDGRQNLRSAYRGKNGPQTGDSRVGFRFVRPVLQ